MTQRYTDPVALNRMGEGLCPECGQPGEIHTGSGSSICSLTDNGVADRIEQGLIDLLASLSPGDVVHAVFDLPERTSKTRTTRAVPVSSSRTYPAEHHEGDYTMRMDPHHSGLCTDGAPGQFVRTGNGLPGTHLTSIRVVRRSNPEPDLRPMVDEALRQERYRQWGA